jgi:hypothetical protein
MVVVEMEKTPEIPKCGKYHIRRKILYVLVCVDVAMRVFRLVNVRRARVGRIVRSGGNC